MQETAVLRARVPKKWIEAMAEDANRDALTVSDITRRAVRKYLGRRATLARKQK